MVLFITDVINFHAKLSSKTPYPGTGAGTRKRFHWINKTVFLWDFPESTSSLTIHVALLTIALIAAASREIWQRSLWKKEFRIYDDMKHIFQDATVFLFHILPYMLFSIGFSPSPALIEVQRIGDDFAASCLQVVIVCIQAAAGWEEEESPRCFPGWMAHSGSSLSKLHWNENDVG